MKHTLKRFFNRLSDGDKKASADDDARNVQVATCALFLEMAHLDDTFTDEETAVILSILKDKYRLSDDHADQLLGEARRELDDSIDLWQFAKLINENFSIDEKLQVIRTLWEIVFVDGKMDRYENYLMHKVATLLRISHEKLIDMKLEVMHNTSWNADACAEPENRESPEGGKQTMIRVVFHLDVDEVQRLNMALGNIMNLLKEIPASEAAVCLVANGSAVKLFRREGAPESLSNVQALYDQGVRFLMCNNSLNNFKIDRTALVKGCDVTKAGVLELIERQADGYAYIKP